MIIINFLMPDHGKVIWWRDSECKHMNPHGNPIHVSFSGIVSAGFPTVEVRHALPMTCPLIDCTCTYRSAGERSPSCLLLACSAEGASCAFWDASVRDIHM